MYTKPGLEERTDGVALLDLADTLRQAAPVGMSYDQIIKQFWESISKNFRRKIRFLTQDEVFIASSPNYTFKSAPQLAFAHLVCRWFHKLKIPGFPTYPAKITYRLNPRLTLDECVDRLIAKRIIYPSWEDIGTKEATVEEVMPVFIHFLRHLNALAKLRATLTQRLRRWVAHVGYNIASGVQPDQFDKSFFLAFCDPNSGTGKSTYLDATDPIALVENNDPLVIETIKELRTCVEAGPFIRFGIMRSNQLIQELFAYYGAWTSTLEFSYGYGVEMGPFKSIVIEENESFTWDLALQEDAIRDHVAVYSQSGVDVIAAPPIINTRPMRKSVESATEGLFSPSLDVPQVELFMSDGIKSFAHNYYAQWHSALRGRVVSTEAGFGAAQLMQDIALTNGQAGEGLTAVLTLKHWPLFDDSDLMALAAEGSFNKLSFFADSPIKERIMYRAPNGKFTDTWVDMTPFYSARGTLMTRPAFSEFMAVHREMLYKPNERVVSYIANKLNLTRGARRASEALILISHNWNEIKRLFGVEPMKWEQLDAFAKLAHGGVNPTEAKALPGIPDGVRALDDLSAPITRTGPKEQKQ